MRLPRRLTIGLLAAASLCATLGADAQAGVNQGLCHGNSTRLSVPSEYAIDACLNGSSLVLRDSIQMVFTVSRTGDIGNPSRAESDYGVAAGAERANSSDPNIFLPGDQLTFPVGPGGGSVTIHPSSDNGFYSMAGLFASIIPGKTSAVGQALVGLFRSSTTTTPSTSNAWSARTGWGSLAARPCWPGMSSSPSTGRK
jgi:hypothetical protein